MNSGSFFLADNRRMVSSFRPFGIVTDSISVTKPAVYSRSRKDAMGSAAVSIWELIWKDSMWKYRQRHAGQQAGIRLGPSSTLGVRLGGAAAYLRCLPP